MKKTASRKPNKMRGKIAAGLCVAAVGVAAWLFFIKEYSFNSSAMPENDAVIVLEEQTDLTKGKTLLQALKDRKTSRNFQETELSKEHLSGLLWAATGVNRRDENKMTVPTSRNTQNMTVYALFKEGAYRYNPKTNKLTRVSENDLRADSGTQEYVGKAPVNLVITASYDGISVDQLPAAQGSARINTGYISQNIYLYCAAFDIGTVARGLVDRKTLAQKLGLGPNEEIILAQSVGYLPQ